MVRFVYVFMMCERVVCVYVFVCVGAYVFSCYGVCTLCVYVFMCLVVGCSVLLFRYVCICVCVYVCMRVFILFAYV